MRPGNDQIMAMMVDLMIAWGVGWGLILGLSVLGGGGLGMPQLGLVFVVMIATYMAARDRRHRAG
jgi:hypothetical protein